MEDHSAEFLNVLQLSKSVGEGFMLNNVSFDQPRFRNIAVAGETGSGKSTLLKIIAGLVQAGSGAVSFEGVRVKGPDEQLLPGHRKIAYLSQHYELRNHYRVEELLDMANMLTVAEALEISEVCRIGHLLKRRTDQLSGGERQRIALARLLTTRPSLLVLDEPFSNLDPIHKGLLKSVLAGISDRLRITCILASHDPADTLSWADELIILKAGTIVQRGRPADVYYHPADEYVAGLLGSYNLVSREQVFALFSVVINRPAGKKLLIRPECFRVSSAETPGAVPGRVVSSSFYGSYSMLVVSLPGLDILAISTDPGIREGSGVYVGLLTEPIGYM